MREQYAVKIAQEQGRSEALSRLGFAKTAGGWDTFKKVVSAPFRSHFPSSPATTFGQEALHFGAGVGNLARHRVFGSPVDSWNQFQHLRSQGRSAPGAYGKMLRDSFWAPLPANTPTPFKLLDRGISALGLAQIGYDGYRAVTGDPSTRMGDLAALGAGIVATPITGALGMFAGPVAHQAITGVARNLGHRLDAPQAQPIEMPAPRDPIGHYGRAARAWNTIKPGVDGANADALPRST